MTTESQKALALKLRQIRDTFGVMWESERLNDGEKAILIESLAQLSEVIHALGFRITVGRKAVDDSTGNQGPHDSPRGWKGYL
jgi:hypothetical protein